MMKKIRQRILLVLVIISVMMSTAVSLANTQDSVDQKSIQQFAPSVLNQYENTKKLSPLREEDSWWNSHWQYRKEITINHTKIVANQTNFPVLVSLVSDTDLTTKAQSDGDDLVFTDQNRNRLNHEIELYNSSTGQLVSWVCVPALSSIQDTVLYLYYGNTTCANQENSAGTWGSHYRMVQHLSETSDIHVDSSIYGNDGTYYGSTQNAEGGANPNRVYQLSIEINESIDFIVNSDQTNAKATTSSHVPIGSWSYVVGTYDRNAIRVYVNGVEQAA